MNNHIIISSQISHIEDKFINEETLNEIYEYTVSYLTTLIITILKNKKINYVEKQYYYIIVLHIMKYVELLLNRKKIGNDKKKIVIHIIDNLVNQKIMPQIQEEILISFIDGIIKYKILYYITLKDKEINFIRKILCKGLFNLICQGGKVIVIKSSLILISMYGIDVPPSILNFLNMANFIL